MSGNGQWPEAQAQKTPRNKGFLQSVYGRRRATERPSYSPEETMSNFFRELKIAIRYLLKSPGFSLAAVLMLAVGICSTTAIFSIVEGVLLRPLPFPHSDRLVVISDILEGANISGIGADGVGVTVP